MTNERRHEEHEESTERSLGRIEGKLSGIEQRLTSMHSESMESRRRLEGHVDDLRLRVSNIEGVSAKIIGGAVVAGGAVGAFMSWVSKKIGGG